MAERRILLRVQFDGTDFHGWQTQTNLRTAQQTLEGAVATLTQQTSRLFSSSRTDAGVHARGLPVTFVTNRDIPLIGFVRGLNSLLPSDISVMEAVEVPMEFHVRRDALGKIYRYSLWNGPAPSALRARTHWYVKQRLDTDRMNAAAQALLGTHDFSSFRARDCQSVSTTRIMERIEVVGDADGEVCIWLEGNAFLQHMVRIIVGTLVEIGRGLRPERFAHDALVARHRAAAGQTAPPKGLMLHRVKYVPSPFSRH